MQKIRFLLIASVLTAWMAASNVEAKDISVLQETGSAFAAIAKQALPAVVFIDVESTVEIMMPQGRSRSPLDDMFGRVSPYGSPDNGIREYHQQGQGSGFIISKDGYILTNNHVVSDADSITVTLGDGRKFDATVVGTDPKTEVALIKIEDSGDLPYLTLGDSDALQVGEWVLAAGNPFGLSQTITAGIVSAKERSEVGITDYANFIQTDAAVNPGNSGGPLLNIHGEVIGINTAIISQNGSYAGNVGIGFAIPINQAKPIKDQLIANGKISRSVLGIYIQEVDDELAKSFGLAESTGILIGQVMEGSAAEEAGLEAGDVILELNGEKVGKIGSFRSRVAAIPPNSKVDLQIFRDGQSRSITAVTKAMDEEPAALADNDTSILERLGLSVANRPEDAEANNRFGSRNQGVVVAEVEEDGPAWAAGLRPGNIISSVNRRVVEDVDEFVLQLNRGAESGRVLLLVSDGRASRFVVLPVE